MNPFKKIFIRTHQTIIRFFAIFFKVPKPVILRSYKEIASILLLKGKTKPLQVIGKNVAKIEAISFLLKDLENNQIKYTVFSDFVSNPTISNINNGKKIFIKNFCNAIVAIGGGSSIDVAKAIGALLKNPRKNLIKLKGLFKVHHKLPLLVALPTTCGSGSEASIVSVIIDEKTNKKFEIIDFHLVPKYAVIDSIFLKDLPKNILAYSAMDALTHAIESYISRSSNKETRKYSENAVKLICGNILEAYSSLDNMDARTNLLRGSFLAGIAFTNAYVGYVHALAHAIGAIYNLNHGYTCAIILPIILNESLDKCYKKLSQIAQLIPIDGLSDDEMSNAKLLISYIENLNSILEIPSRIKIDDKDVDEIALRAYKEAVPFYPVPKLFSQMELKNIILDKIKE